MTITKKTIYSNEEGFNFTFNPYGETLTIKKTKTGFEARYLIEEDYPIPPNEFDEREELFLTAYHRDFFVENNLVTKDECIALFRQDREDEDYPHSIADKYYIFGLEAYIHSGVRLALSYCGNFPDRRWDVSQVGCVFADKGIFTDEKSAKEAALSLIEEWNQYLSGDVWCCVKEIYNKNKQQINYDICGSVYGYKTAMEELKCY